MPGALSLVHLLRFQIFTHTQGGFEKKGLPQVTMDFIGFQSQNSHIF